MLYQEMALEISYCEKRVLHILDDGEEHNESIKGLYDFIIDKGIKYMDYNEDFYLVSMEDGDEFIAIHIKDDDVGYADLKEYFIEPGRFAGIRIPMKMDDRSFGVADRLIEEAGKRGIKLKGEKLIIEELGTVAYSRSKRYATVQMRIDE